MIYVGFGFLMVFLKKHCWTSVGFNYVIAAWSMQLAILLTGFWHMALVEEEFHKITLDIPSLIIGDFGAGAVLITFGAILGKCTLPQLFVLATLEIIFYALNEGICAGLL
jgi:ammonium transporter Rh